MNSNRRGAISELAIALAAVEAGVEVYKPFSEHARADLIFGLGSRLLRVQCKTAHRRNGVVIVNLVSNWHAPRGYVRRTYSPDEVDGVAAFDPNDRRTYLLPIRLVAGMRAITLRLGPARNGQRAGLHFAAEFELSGAVAQLGERVTGSDEGVGSSPISSTTQSMGEPKAESVGAHEFRNRFGWYMERAAAGEEIRVSRRGRPFVRLLPAEESRPVAERNAA